MKKIYLDTHTAIFLYAGLEEKLPHNILELLKNHQVLISPIVELEIQYLYEIGRITEPSTEILTALLNQIGLEVSPLSFGQVIYQALKESWTQDLFDRIIVSQARLEKAPLISKDRLIHQHYSHAVWDRND